MILSHGKTVAQRLKYCNDLNDLRIRLAGIPFDKKPTAKAIAAMRQRALRGALLGRNVAGDVGNFIASHEDGLAMLREQIEAAKSMPDMDKAATITYASSLAQTLQRIKDLERAHGLSDGGIEQSIGSTLIDDMRSLEKTIDKSTRNSTEIVIDGCIAHGKIGDDLREELAKASEMPSTTERVSSMTAMLASGAAKAKAEQKSRSAELDKVRESVRYGFTKHDEYEKVYAEYAKWIEEVFRPIESASHEIARAQATQRKQAMADAGRKIIDRVLEKSPITADAAAKWAEEQEITKTAQNRLKKSGYTLEQVRLDMAEFYRVSHGRVADIRLDSKGDRRANATNITSMDNVATIYMDGCFGKVTLWHEMAHHVEIDPVASQAASAYIRRRSTDGDNVHRLSALTKNKAYRSDEVAYKGTFFSPYVGKVYGNGVTEVFSMGLESFSDPALLAERALKDPETFEFVAGFVSSTVNPLAKAAMALKEMAVTANAEAKDESESIANEMLSRVAAKAGFHADTSMDWVTPSVEWEARRYDPVGRFDCDPNIRLMYGRRRAEGTGRMGNGYLLFVISERGWSSTWSIPGKDLELACATAYAKSQGSGYYTEAGMRSVNVLKGLLDE